MFQVGYDRSANVLRIKVWGFMAPEDVAGLAAAVGAGVRDAVATRDDFNVMVESLDFAVQANDVADLLSEIMRSGMPLTTGRAAIVVGSVLNKQQVERTLIHPRLRAFMTVDTAEIWLAEAV